ncbi:hypothetical protein D3C85_1153470 [compost metagenome]
MHNAFGPGFQGVGLRAAFARHGQGGRGNVLLGKQPQFVQADRTAFPRLAVDGEQVAIAQGLVVLSQDDATLDDVLQLTDVARPAMVENDLQRLRRHPGHPAAV